VSRARLSLVVLAVLAALGAVGIGLAAAQVASREELADQLPVVGWAGIGGAGLLLLGLGLLRVQLDRVRAARSRAATQHVIDAALRSLAET
jgi:hypothetical protein